MSLSGKTPKILVRVVASGKGDWEVKGWVRGGSSLLSYILSHCLLIFSLCFCITLKKKKGTRSLKSYYLVSSHGFGRVGQLLNLSESGLLHL